MTPDELAYWIGLYEIDPWGERRADIRESVIGSAVVSPWCKNPPNPSDLIPDYDQEQARVIDQKKGLLAWQQYIIEHNKGRRKNN